MRTHRHELRRLVSTLVLAACLGPGNGCDDAPRGPEPTETATTETTNSPRGSAEPARTAGAASPHGPQTEDRWFWVGKGGHELGVVEVLAGKPWRVVLHRTGDDARQLEQLVTSHAAAPIGLKMHLPPAKGGGRGPLGSVAIPPGDKLYPMAVEEHLQRQGFDVRDSVPRFENANPPTSVSKPELRRDGVKLGTLDLSAAPPKLELESREADALTLETLWKELDAEEQLAVSYLSREGGKDALVTVSAKKGSAEYARQVHLAFAVRYPSYDLTVLP